ncbi:hypothetical protein BBO_08869 [Beauveria brongniartii RCEF 3172]|uniref:GPI anchored protein n=1 Tax=Beauveria brongniartii RCEF 3172 TaxID=1081107 RepID=A0A166WZP2_9HYPO|nr:hypothetical protein BBO_08869 [Beauveria brongniartii RCEF 3172]
MVFYAALAITGFAAFTTATAGAETNSVGAGFFFHIPGPSSSSINSRTLLTSRQKTGHQCLKGLASCDTECIDASFECCHVGQGQACEEGYTCYSQGCCRKGQTCSGPPKGCTATTKMCDVGCIPRDRVCCGLGDGSSCDADTVCLDSGLCGRQKSDIGPGSSSSGAGSASSRPSQTATLSTGGSAIVPGSSGLSSAGTSLRTRSDSAIGASITSSVSEVSGGGYSLLPVTSTSGSRGDASSDVPSASQPNPTTTDKAAAGATLEAPSSMARLFALAAYVAVVQIYFY